MKMKVLVISIVSCLFVFGACSKNYSCICTDQNIDMTQTPYDTTSFSYGHSGSGSTSHIAEQCPTKKLTQSIGSKTITSCTMVE